MFAHAQARGSQRQRGNARRSLLLITPNEQSVMTQPYQAVPEQAFGALFEHSPVPMLVSDALTLRYLAVNQRAIEEYGYTREELLGMRVSDLRPSPLARHRKKDGTLIDVEIVSQLVRLGDREVILAVATDITDRLRAQQVQLSAERRAAEQIRRSEERFALAARGTNDGLWDWDILQDTQFVSPRFVELLGYREGEIDDTRSFITRRLHPDDEVRQHTALMQHLEQQTPYDVELRLATKDGTYRWFRVRGQAVFEPGGHPVRMVGSATDMAERKLIERALLESEQRFRSLIDNAADPILILSKDGKLRYLSPANERALGYPASELVGTDGKLLMHPDDRKRVAKVFGALLEHPDQAGQAQYRLRHKDGSWRTFSSVARNLIADRAISGIVVNSRDITAQAALEEQLRHSQKMEAVGMLAGGVAHDFNNMLTAITSFAEFISAQLPEGSKIEADLAQIRIAADRAVGLTRQLLAFSRKQVMQPRVLEVNKLVGGLDQMLRRLIGEDVELRTSLSDGLPAVKADPSQLEQVLVNLVVNARDAMPRGGQLTIETECVLIDEAVARNELEVKPGRYLLIAVRDTGIGIDAETQARIFEPFFTTKTQGRGTGLGLSTVYGVVKQNGGHIRVESALGQGTTFKIYLPASDSLPTLAALPAREVGDLRGHETILVVEDEELVRVAVRTSLERLGYTVICAGDGDEASILARAHTGVIDLLLTDVIMPRQNGRQVADQLQIMRPGLQVIFMSGYAENAIVHHGVLDENLEFLEKPFTQTSLVRKIRQVLDRRRMNA